MKIMTYLVTQYLFGLCAVKNGPHFLNTINQIDFKKSFIMTDTNIVDIYINYLMAQ